MTDIISLINKIENKFKIRFTAIDLFMIIVHIKELSEVTVLTTKDKSYASGYLERYLVHKTALNEMGVTVGAPLRNPKDIKSDISRVIRRYTNTKETYISILRTLGEEGIGNLPMLKIEPPAEIPDDGWSNCTSEDYYFDDYNSLSSYEQMIVDATMVESEIGSQRHYTDENGKDYSEAITESFLIDQINKTLSKI